MAFTSHGGSSRCWMDLEMLKNEVFDECEVLLFHHMRSVSLGTVVPRIEANWQTGLLKHADVAS